ncbi:kanadaptin [Leptopilina boulardi]|uniref:kanadaptin n=1 Tax=Leptopilina boulardi TaxID=63433 RepID=UPI0021F67673|nr:kanadaptin [Leptopilina boulardi]
MEVPEKLNCEKNLENTINENVVAESSTNIEKIESNETMEIEVSKIESSNEKEENLNSEDLKNIEIKIASGENVTEKLVDNSPQIESLQHTFKKPDLLIGPRKGKPTARKVVNLNEKSENSIIQEVETKCDSENFRITTEKCDEKQREKEEEGKEKETEKIIKKDEKSLEVKKNEVEIEKLKEKQLRERKQIIEKEKQIPLPYREPTWSGKPENKYKAEILKSGQILETIDLSEKNFYVVGRLPICDIPLANPTISRYHAIFQYRNESDEKNEKGLYVYDLGSTHGTFWNGNRIRKNIYVRVRNGHMIKFGNSQRKFIMQTPREEEEEESELTVTELKEKRRIEMEERTKMELERQKEEELAEKLRLEKEENEGVDWGMSEDADEETDLKENPYAQTNNEELFLEDPKKTLRGWFEREGHDLQYQAEENGIGRFTCWVELPIDDYVGRSVKAEACVKGKKKEAVVQCALEACRILDRHGLLRQAVHESKKKKARNWEEQDFYDSDEDNFLDRTGAVEQKREQRMRNAGKLNAKAETYNSLTEKYEEVMKQIENIENRLKQSRDNENMEENLGVDALDAFMSKLKSASILNKSEKTKLKMDLQKLHKEEAQLLKLIDISKPANLPALKPQTSKSVETLPTKRKSFDNSPKFEKKMKKSIVSQPNEESETMNKEKDSPSEEEFSENKSDEKSMKIAESSEVFVKKNNKDDTNVNDEKNKVEKCAEIVNEQKEMINESVEEKNDDEEVLRKKRRNMKRIQQRALKAEKEKIKSYEEEEYKEDYCTWVPPQGQSGDGKTSLNDKFGY